MKMHISPLKTIMFLAIAVAPLLSSASDGDHTEKKRTISKTYTVSQEDRLSIENSFGNITVNTWDKNVIQVDIEIGVHSTTDDKAQHMMDQINVIDNQEGKDIRFKTEIGNMGKGNKDNGNEGDRKFYVDYKITMPSKNPLNIENSFGKISIPDFAGTTSLTSKFGELTTGKIPNAKLIHVEFGRAEIGRLNNAEVIFKFNSHSQVAGLSGNSKMDVQFCSHVDVIVDNAITDLSLFQSYSSIYVKVSNSLSAKFDVYTNFGSFKNRTDFNISPDNEDDNSGPKFDRTYSGTAGGGAGKIKIKSSFGNVRLMNLDDVSKDKDDSGDEDKDGDKTKVNL
jgi:hypothetical protein